MIQERTLDHEILYFTGNTNDHDHGTAKALNLALTNPVNTLDNSDNSEFFPESGVVVLKFNNFVLSNILVMRQLIAIILLTLSLNCQGQNIQSDMKSKRLSPTVEMESPIFVKLEIEIKNNKIFAVTTFKNFGNKEILYDRYKMGGNNLREEVFFVKPIPYTSNLTFEPYVPLFDRKKPDYIALSPNEVQKNTTELTKYFNFNEQSYDEIEIIYSAKIFYMNENGEQIYDNDNALLKRPIVFYCTSNNVKINSRDIKTIQK